MSRSHSDGLLPQDLILAVSENMTRPDFRVGPYIYAGGEGSGYHGPDHKGLPGVWGGSRPREEGALDKEPTGECFQSAGRWMIDEGDKLGEGDAQLVHGLVSGQGPLEGRRFIHAWIEVGDVVIDPEQDVMMRKERYYEIAQINEDELSRYTRDEMMHKLARTQHWGPWEGEEDFDKLYPIAGDTVGGREVSDNVPNLDSISASVPEWEELPGIRELRVDDFYEEGEMPYYYSVDKKERTLELAEALKDSDWIEPLIVVLEKEGLYVLEGATRIDALRELGEESFPALVIVDRESIPGEETVEIDPKSKSFLRDQDIQDSAVEELADRYGKTEFKDFHNAAWMSPDGELLGDLADHQQSAQDVAKHVGLEPADDEEAMYLMRQMGFIRMASSGNHLGFDIETPLTASQKRMIQDLIAVQGEATTYAFEINAPSGWYENREDHFFTRDLREAFARLDIVERVYEERHGDHHFQTGIEGHRGGSQPGYIHIGASTKERRKHRRYLDQRPLKWDENVDYAGDIAGQILEFQDRMGIEVSGMLITTNPDTFIENCAKNVSLGNPERYKDPIMQNRLRGELDDYLQGTIGIYASEKMPLDDPRLSLLYINARALFGKMADPELADYLVDHELGHWILKRVLPFHEWPRGYVPDELRMKLNDIGYKSENHLEEYYADLISSYVNNKDYLSPFFTHRHYVMGPLDFKLRDRLITKIKEQAPRGFKLKQRAKSSGLAIAFLPITDEHYEAIMIDPKDAKDYKHVVVIDDDAFVERGSEYSGYHDPHVGLEGVWGGSKPREGHVPPEQLTEYHETKGLRYTKYARRARKSKPTFTVKYDIFDKDWKRTGEEEKEFGSIGEAIKFYLERKFSEEGKKYPYLYAGDISVRDNARGFWMMIAIDIKPEQVDLIDWDMEYRHIEQVHDYMLETLSDPENANFIMKIDYDGEDMIRGTERFYNLLERSQAGQSLYSDPLRGLATYNIVFTTDPKNIGAGSNSVGSFGGKTFWEPISLPDDQKKERMRSSIDLALLPFSVMLHEGHHGFGSGSELDNFTQVITMDYALEHPELMEGMWGRVIEGEIASTAERAVWDARGDESHRRIVHNARAMTGWLYGRHKDWFDSQIDESIQYWADEERADRGEIEAPERPSILWYRPQEIKEKLDKWVRESNKPIKKEKEWWEL